jgi:hypothetical protein
MKQVLKPGLVVRKETLLSSKHFLYMLKENLGVLNMSWVEKNHATPERTFPPDRKKK